MKQFQTEKNLPVFDFKKPVVSGGLAFCLLFLGTSVFGQSDLPSPSTLKKMSLDELMDIEVTSVSRRPEKLFEAASAIQVITGEDIHRFGANSIPEALRLATNLEVAQTDSRQWAISARGFNNLFADKMLVMIDGRSVYTPLFAGVYWDVQDTVLEDIDRIEVISGPGATQWGSNAVNGVINITTKSAKDTQGGLLVAGAGTQLRYSDEARYGGTLAPNIYYRVYTKYSYHSDTKQMNGEGADDAWRIGQTGFRLDWDAPTGNTLTLQGDIYDSVMGQIGRDYIRANGSNLIGRWARTISEDNDVNLQAYYDRTHRRIPGSFTEDVDTYDIDFQHHFALGSHNGFMWGFGYRLIHDGIVNTPDEAFLPASVNRQLFSAFLQDEITLYPDQLHLTIGTKIEHNDYTGAEWEPSGRLAWTPDKKQTIWGAVSRAVRTPSRVDHDLYSPANPPYRIAGGEKVLSERLISSELGYRVQLKPQVSFSVATYYNYYDDLRSLEPLRPPKAFPVVESSGLEGESKGAEFTAEWTVTSDWRLRAGWTEMRVWSGRQSGTQDRAIDATIEHDPNHEATLRSILNITSKWDCDVTLRYIAPIDSQAVPSYTDGDVRIGWHPIQGWEFSILGQNLLHKRHAEFNTPDTRREALRSIFGKVTWRL